MAWITLEANIGIWNFTPLSLFPFPKVESTQKKIDGWEVALASSLFSFNPLQNDRRMTKLWEKQSYSTTEKKVHIGFPFSARYYHH